MISPEKLLKILTQAEQLHLPGRLLSRQEPAEICRLPPSLSNTFPGLIKPGGVSEPDQQYGYKNNNQDNQWHIPEVP